MILKSLLHLLGALGVYLVIVSMHLASVSPLTFTIVTALALAFGFFIHSAFRTTSTVIANKSNPEILAVIPPLTESMHQLSALQAEINQLQADFARDSLAVDGRQGNAANDASR